MARRSLPVNIVMTLLLLFSAASILLTGVDIDPATEYIMYISAAFLGVNFAIIYAVYRYRM